MRKELTDITVVMDRSGSMSTVQSEAEGGLNSFIEDQKGKEGDALFTLVQFDTEYEFVHRGVPIGEVPRCRLQPRGMTALLDAVGKSIHETGERLSAMDESARPGLVVFVILTDGQENSSREFRREQIKEMISRQQSDYNWQFVFLGANQDAFAEAGSIGIQPHHALNYAEKKTGAAYVVSSGYVGRMRSCVARGQSLSHALITDAERDSLLDDIDDD